MSPEEVIDLLTTAAAFDRRTVGEADVIAWQAAVGDLEFEDAKTAVVQHYRTTRDWIMPSDVRRLVKAIRETRIAREVVPAPDAELSDDARAYKAVLQREIARVASGFAMPKAITSGRGAQPNREYLDARGEDPHRGLRVASLATPCPHCQAASGDRCINGIGKPLTSAPAHDARLVAAGLARWSESAGGQRFAELISEVA